MIGLIDLFLGFVVGKPTTRGDSAAASPSSGTIVLSESLSGSDELLMRVSEEEFGTRVVSDTVYIE